jgi:hypothetical protein
MTELEKDVKAPVRDPMLPSKAVEKEWSRLEVEIWLAKAK